MEKLPDETVVALLNNIECDILYDRGKLIELGLPHDVALSMRDSFEGVDGIYGLYLLYNIAETFGLDVDSIRGFVDRHDAGEYIKTAVWKAIHESKRYRKRNRLAKEECNLLFSFYRNLNTTNVDNLGS